jgi:hypothetical protein
MSPFPTPNQQLSEVTRRIIVAFAIAPMVPGILIPIITLMNVGFPYGAGEFLISIFLTYLYALTGTVVVALPAFLTARRFGLLHWWVAAAAGFTLGILCAALFKDSETAPILRGYWPLAAVGTVAGWVFWLISQGGNRSLTGARTDAPCD